MSIVSMTQRHVLRHYRQTMISGEAGGKVPTVVELGNKKGTVNPDSDYETPDFGTRNQEQNASIYFSYDPGVRTNDYLQVLSVWVNGGYRPVSNGPVYRVESNLDVQIQNRLWRVRATQREAL